MDNNDGALADVKEFKIARVGRDNKKKKKGGFLLRGARGAKAPWQGALGGSGAGGFGSIGELGAAASEAAGAGAAAGESGGLAALLGLSGEGGIGGAISSLLASMGVTSSNALLIVAATAAAGLAAVAVGDMAGFDKKSDLKDRPQMFVPKDSSASAGGKITAGSKDMPNSIGYVVGSLDGLTPEERARKAAEEEARKAAEDAARRKAEEEAAKAAQIPQGPDAAALAAAAAANANANAAAAQRPVPGFGGGSAFSTRIGSLSGGFAGGGGRSLTSAPPVPFNGGGSAGKGGAAPGASNGKISAAKTPGRSAIGSSSRGRNAASNRRGFVEQQLDQAAGLGKQGVGMKQNEASAATVGSPFDGGNGNGSSVQGPGLTNGGNSGGGNPNSPSNPGGSNGGASSGSTAGDGSSSSSSGDGGASDGDGVGATDGTSGSTGDQVCNGADQAPDADGKCVTIKTDPGTDASPWKSLEKWAQRMLYLIAGLAVLAMILEKNPFTYAMSKVFRGIIGGIGAMIAVMGAMIIAQGDLWSGLIFAGIGGFVAAACWSGFGDKYLTAPGALISAGAGTLLQQAVTKMAPNKDLMAGLQ